MNDRDAHAAPLAFDRTGDVSGVSAQWIAERTARYGTWLPAGRSGSAAPDETTAAAGHVARRVWVGTPLRVVATRLPVLPNPGSPLDLYFAPSDATLMVDEVHV